MMPGAECNWTRVRSTVEGVVKVPTRGTPTQPQMACPQRNAQHNASITTMMTFWTSNFNPSTRAWCLHVHQRQYRYGSQLPKPKRYLRIPRSSTTVSILSVRALESLESHDRYRSKVRCEMEEQLGRGRQLVGSGRG